MIFIDSGAFIARYIAADQHHPDAVLGWSNIASKRISCCTSNFVISESLTLLARMAGHSFAADTGRLLCTSPSLSILRPDSVEELLAVELFGKYADQKVSFCDCMSFVLMRKLGIRHVFGFDRHFQIVGFEQFTPR